MISSAKCALFATAHPKRLAETPEIDNQMHAVVFVPRRGRKGSSSSFDLALRIARLLNDVGSIVSMSHFTSTCDVRTSCAQHNGFYPSFVSYNVSLLLGSMPCGICSQVALSLLMKLSSRSCQTITARFRLDLQKEIKISPPACLPTTPTLAQHPLYLLAPTFTLLSYRGMK